MKTKFEQIFNKIIDLFEMDSASVMGGSAHTGDYSISYAEKDARNIVGNASINSIPDPNKSKKNKKRKRNNGMLMPIQRRPVIGEGHLKSGEIIFKYHYDVYVQQTPTSTPAIVYRNVLARNEEDAIRQYLKYKRGNHRYALSTYQYYKIWAEKKEDIKPRTPYAD